MTILAVSPFLGFSCAAPRACAGGIFTDTRRSGSVDQATRPTVRRQRRVEVDVARVLPPGEGGASRVTFNLFPDVCVIAHREQATGGGPGPVQWEGRVTGASSGTATLVIDGTIVVGTIRIGGEVYEIRYLGDGVHVVTDVDPSKFPPD